MKIQFVVYINVFSIIVIARSNASPRFYYNYSLKTRNPPTEETMETPYTTTQWRWLQPQENNNGNYKVFKKIYRKDNENFYQIFYSGMKEQLESNIEKTTSFTIQTATPSEYPEMTALTMSSPTTSTLPSTTPEMDSPLALSITTESKLSQRPGRLDVPLKIYGIPKELLPIMPGGGSRFEDVEREKLEKKKMSQTKGKEHNTAENGGSHETEGLYSSGSLATFYLLFYSFIPTIIFNILLFGS